MPDGWRHVHRIVIHKALALGEVREFGLEVDLVGHGLGSQKLT